MYNDSLPFEYDDTESADLHDEHERDSRKTVRIKTTITTIRIKTISILHTPREDDERVQIPRYRPAYRPLNRDRSPMQDPRLHNPRFGRNFRMN